MTAPRPRTPYSATRVRPRHVPRQSRRYKPYKMRVQQALWLVPLVMIIGFGGVLGFFVSKEMRTSRIQSQIFTEMVKDVASELRTGPAPVFQVPQSGPYNQRLGYSYLPFFIKALEGEGYATAAQMRNSLAYEKLVGEGLYPIYKPKTVAGLLLKDRTGRPLYVSHFPSHVFSSFDAIPPLLVQTLLFVEDRDLLHPSAPSKNPVIEWDRFFYAAFGQLVKYFVPTVNMGGGSTLATQIEKFRFSPGGQTRSPMEKIRQIISSSLRVYQQGKNTRAARKNIVLDYFNSTPLSARRGFGEINSIGDGFWAWFGRDIDEVTTALNLPETDIDSLRLKGTVYREALGLILAQRRPTYYLLTDRAALDSLTDNMLEILLKKNIISYPLYKATRLASFHFLPEVPPRPALDYLEQKAPSALRTRLLGLLGVKNLYELDRLDLTATSTLDLSVQENIVNFMKMLSDPAFLQEEGMVGPRLILPENDPTKINWSFILYEKSKKGNLLRVQADNIHGPLDMNDGVKLDLGSTAKLRTLVTYLQIITEIYNRHTGLSYADLRTLSREAPDILTEWVAGWMANNPEGDKETLLRAAMDRRYSASPKETFFTGGGEHVFVNFDHSEDHQIMNLHEALRDSVNLVFVRLMRDIVNYTISQGQQTKQEILGDPDHPARKAYLERYADREGKTFLRRYMRFYKGMDAAQILEKAASRAHKGHAAQTILFRALFPEAPYEEYEEFMKAHNAKGDKEEALHKLYEEYPPARYDLADKGYITGVNPLELWLASYKITNPNASNKAILAVSKPVRIECYSWLFHKGQKGAQDARIRILLEADAFARIHKRWEKLGYPFDRLVPSLATAIGSSADRPSALAELLGIILNDGHRKPMMRFEKMHFAENTPYETIMMPKGDEGKQVLDPTIAKIVRATMLEVTQNGTAKRLRGSYVNQKGEILPIGAKTGTGDHRYDEYGPGHKLISSRVVNRTGTIMFFIGDRFFGTLTAHVQGEIAGTFKFTSSVAVQALKSMAPLLHPLVASAEPEEGLLSLSRSMAPLSMAPLSQPVIIEAPASKEKTESPAAPEFPPETPPKNPTAPLSIPAGQPLSSQDLMMDILPQ